MSNPTSYNVAQIIVEELMGWKVANNRKAYRRYMTALSERLIRYMSVFNGGGLEPTANHVSEIIVEDMQKWNPNGSEADRQSDLFALADRLITYFTTFYAQPRQLDGLPGGLPYGP